MESKILNLIKTNPDWREIIRQKHIAIKEEDNLALFKYGIDCDWSDPIVCEARGIIIDTATKRVVCWPFDKFFNVQEQYAAEIDWNDCRVEQKIDGSIVKLWHHGIWRWSTNACIRSSEAYSSDSQIPFLALIRNADNYKNIDFDSLDKSCTYIFELVSPQNQIVIQYNRTLLYHIGTRNNQTGEELTVDIGIQKPKIYENIHSIDECLEAVKHLNSGSEVREEGFVVVDHLWRRIKVKTAEYLELHRAWDNGHVSAEKIIKLLMERPAHELCTDWPRLEVYIKYYDFKLAELTNQIDRYIGYVRNLYEEYDHDRKAVANVIKNDQLSGCGFAAIGNNLTGRDLLRAISLSKLVKMIPKYEEKTWEKQ